MKSLKQTMNRNLSLIIALVLIASSCQQNPSGSGELIGVADRNRMSMPTPFGMVYVPGGYFTMGSGGEDVTYAMTYSPKQVSISAFYMDNTEITNNEYRQFVAWVTDSIMRRMLGETLPQFLIETDDPDAMPNINYRTAIKKSVEVDEALETLYLPNEERFYHKKELDVRKLNYEYQWFDYMQAAQKSWDNLEARTDGVNIASFINRPQSLKSRAGYVRKEIVNVYPDTLCWFIDFSYSYNDPYVRSYFSSPMYDHYPVVGVNWHQAQAFCQWRTITYNSVLASRGLSTEVFRLPTEAEWEFAARGGLDMNPYPWGGPYASNINGCFLGNFKPQRGRYSMDGGNRPVIVGHYAPNDYGLYDMMGNVSEWCEDAYSDSYDVLHDLDPVFKYRADESDHVTKKRKVIRGGSFKDFAEITKVYYRTYEYQDTCKSYVGFRCVMSYLGRARSDTKVSESNVY